MDEIDRQTQLSLQDEFRSFRRKRSLRVLAAVVVMFPWTLPMFALSIVRFVVDGSIKILEFVSTGLTAVMEGFASLGALTGLPQRMWAWIGEDQSWSRFVQDKLKQK